MRLCRRESELPLWAQCRRPSTHFAASFAVRRPLASVSDRPPTIARPYRSFGRRVRRPNGSEFRKALIPAQSIARLVFVVLRPAPYFALLFIRGVWPMIQLFSLLTSHEKHPRKELGLDGQRTGGTEGTTNNGDC